MMWQLLPSCTLKDQGSNGPDGESEVQHPSPES